MICTHLTGKYTSRDSDWFAVCLSHLVILQADLFLVTVLLVIRRERGMQVCGGRPIVAARGFVWVRLENSNDLIVQFSENTFRKVRPVGGKKDLYQPYAPRFRGNAGYRRKCRLEGPGGVKTG